MRKAHCSRRFASEYRYHHTDTDGQRKLKVQTSDSIIYETERDVRDAGALAGVAGGAEAVAWAAVAALEQAVEGETGKRDKRPDVQC